MTRFEIDNLHILNWPSLNHPVSINTISQFNSTIPIATSITFENGVGSDVSVPMTSLDFTRFIFLKEITIGTNALNRVSAFIATNLMNNSMKFTEKGTITVGYEYDQRESLLKFFVRDTGIGIPKNKVKEIFHRFTKLNTFIQGSGLGLSICEMIVHKLGGRIWVDSEIDRGTCFWFTVPYQFTE